MADLQEAAAWVASVKECRAWAGPGITYPIRIEQLADEIGLTPENAFVLKEGGNRLAFGQIIQTSEHVCHLARIIVSKRHRGKGIGRVFCRKLIQEAERSPGICRLTLRVYRHNHAAVKLYQSLGFRETGKPQNATAMSMTLIL